MKQVDEMPTSGQFSALLDSNGRTYFAAMQWIDGELISVLHNKAMPSDLIAELISTGKKNQCKFFIAD